MKIFIFLLGLAASTAFADTKVTYSLTGLKPQGLSQYSAVEVGGSRQYLRYQGDKAMHYLIYEEVDGLPPRKDIANLRQASQSGAVVTCDLEIVCETKAFCTGDCKNMYYEFTNGNPAPGRNHCTLQSFDCWPGDHAVAPVTAPAAPATTPAPVK